MNMHGIDSIENVGLKASPEIFSRIKAFDRGGFYWDHQDLIRASLGEFLPSVRQVQEAGNSFGIFYKVVGVSDVLWKSTSLGNSKVPKEEIDRLNLALDKFKQKSTAPDTQQNAKEIIEHFRLPDISKDPDLYRICGPWWDRKLQVLWGCERSPDTSLLPTAAVAKLPIDNAYRLKQALSVLALLLLICSIIASMLWGWPFIKKFASKVFNKAPVAALKLDSLDETNRSVTISDNGSKDSDGTITNWHIAWGDGQEVDFSKQPLKVSHSYTTERDYTITLSCADNYSKTSSPPASVDARFDYQKRQKILADANRVAEGIKNEAEKLKQQAKDATDKALREQELAAKNKGESEKSLEDAKKAKDELAAQQQEAEKAVEKAKIEQQQSQKAAEQALKEQQEAQKAQEKAKKDQEEALAKKQEAQRAQEIAQKAKEEAEKKANSLSLAQQPDKNNAIQPSTTNTLDKAENNSPAKKTIIKPGLDDRKGGQILADNNASHEIVKASSGKVRPDGTLDAMLVVRDKRYPNANVNVLDWEVDDKKYSAKNAQFTSRLAVGDHMVRVRVRISPSEISTISAKVTVTTSVTQVTEPNFVVTPIK